MVENLSDCTKKIQLRYKDIKISNKILFCFRTCNLSLLRTGIFRLIPFF